MLTAAPGPAATPAGSAAPTARSAAPAEEGSDIATLQTLAVHLNKAAAARAARHQALAAELNAFGEASAAAMSAKATVAFADASRHRGKREHHSESQGPRVSSSAHGGHGAWSSTKSATTA